MWLVASETIEPGMEIRIDYENGGKKGQYWRGVQPDEGPWRTAGRIEPPPPSLSEPVVGRLRELCANRGPRAAGPEAFTDASAAPWAEVQGDPLPWEGAAGGDARMKTLVPLLAQHLSVRLRPACITNRPLSANALCSR